nr:hypothetical protein Iba_chr08cCG8720 [Ipomoea batatas]
MSSSWEDVGVAVASMVLATFSMFDKPENVFLITFTGAPCFPISAIASPNSPTVEANFCRIPATLSTLDDGIFNAATGALQQLSTEKKNGEGERDAAKDRSRYCRAPPPPITESSFVAAKTRSTVHDHRLEPISDRRMIDRRPKPMNKSGVSSVNK